MKSYYIGKKKSTTNSNKTEKLIKIYQFNNYEDLKKKTCFITFLIKFRHGWRQAGQSRLTYVIRQLLSWRLVESFYNVVTLKRSAYKERKILGFG